MEINLATRAIAGQKIVDVKNFGATGAGTKDDTASINNAISALGEAGGTVLVPRGKYLVDAVAQIRMASRVHLKMHPLAELITIPNGAVRYGLIAINGVTDVVVSGGVLHGDRDEHNYSLSGTHEWGHGFQVYGSQRVSILGVQALNFTGDGLSIGRRGTVRSNDIEIADSVFTRNRRQGISIVTGDNVTVYRTECSYTGDVRPGEATGTAPMCGIDVEPEKNAGAIRNIRIVECRLVFNQRFGFLLERRTDEDGGADVFDVDFVDNEVAYNFSNGFQNKGGTRLMFHGNHVHDNSASGTVWTRDIDSKVWGNNFGRNYTRNGVKLQNPPFTLTGTDKRTTRDILKQLGSNVNVLTNDFY